MKYLKPTQFHCFSPPVMILTFAIEIALAVYVTVRYKLNNITKLAVAILFFLAVFQLAEYNVCEGSFGIDSLSWSRLGFVAITMLPPLGLHLATRLARQKQTALLTAAYTGAGAFAAFFAFSGHGITSQACLGNYVIFKTAPDAIHWYTLHYYIWLIVAVGYALQVSRQVKTIKQSLALKSLAFGYLAFMVPTTLVNIINPATIVGIPSIMCGFAVMLALTIAGEVLPHYYKDDTATEVIRHKFTGIFNGRPTR